MTEGPKTYKVLVNGFEFTFSASDLDKIDLIKRSASTFHLLKDNHSVNAELIEYDSGSKKLEIELDGELFSVEIKDELDQVLDKMGLSAVANKQIKEIRAPMPGLVLEIAVTDGQDVNEGDKILILEAMKMENSIMIHTQAKIKKVAVTAGQAVEKGQVLVELE